MKHTTLVFYSIFWMPYIIFGMEYIELQPTNTFTIETVNLINEKISKEYIPHNELVDFFTLLQLTEKEMLAIINLANSWCEKTENKLTETLIDALCKKNIFFNEAITYFCTCARKNLDNATYATINIVDNPALAQPVAILNSIPQTIKEYVMQYTRNSITLSYEIPLVHSRNVNLYTIHPKTDTIATYCRDAFLRTWDLKTGAILTALKEIHPITHIYFNENGTLMGTISRCTTKNNHVKSLIKIYIPHAKQLLHTILQDDCAYHINFMPNQPISSSSILSVFTYEKEDLQDRILTLWQLSDTQKPIKLCSSSPLPWRKEQYIEFLSDKEKYEGYIDNRNKTMLVTKKKCAELYICKQAIENNNQENIPNTFYSSQPYLQLTPYEQELVNTAITMQKPPTKENNPLLLALQSK